MTHLGGTKWLAYWCAVAVCLAAGTAGAQAYPPRAIEIGPDHPLFIFHTSGLSTADPAAFALDVVRVWNALPDALRPFSTMRIEMYGPTMADRHLRLRAALERLQEANIPVIVQISDEEPRRAYPVEFAEELVRDFVCIKGLMAAGLTFDEYPQFGPDPAAYPPAHVQWLIGLTDVAARYGRFLAIQLDGLHWPRLMSNASCRRLYEKFRQCSPYVIPIAHARGGHDIPRMTSAMGLWLEDTVEHWGFGATSAWYSDANLLEPGLFGRGPAPSPMPSQLYRAMILNGAMTGATVYSFEAGTDLWFGAMRGHWDTAIRPALSEIVERNLIARREFVQEKARVAYQLRVCHTPEDFHLNLRDIDGELNAGLMLRGAYGMERPGQIPELIPNSGRHYWVPILSPYAPQPVLERFARVVQPGVLNSPQEWIDLLDRDHRPDGIGTAFISRIGLGIFVMNNREAYTELQSFRIPNVPAPVRGIEARRRDDGVLVTWPLREGDVGWKVYRRTPPDGRFALVANDLDTREWLDRDSPPEAVVAYAVTALTTEDEPYEGTVNFGDYLALSTVESRIEEEAVISPLLLQGRARPVEQPPPAFPERIQWWPSFAGVPEAQLGAAQGIVERIEAFDRAFSERDLDGLMELYSPEYEDPEGWRRDYVRRAFQWFFERHAACRMDRQIRSWDFSRFDGYRTVAVLVYCNFAGTAVSDPTGRFADRIAQFPRNDTGEVLFTFADEGGLWRIVRTEPALPNFKDILSFSAGPYDSFEAGPDRFIR